MTAHTHTQEYVSYRVVVDDVVCTNDPTIHLNVGALWFWPSDRSRWLIVARRFIWLLLVGITESTHIFALIGSVQPLPYSPNRYTINITVLTLESPSSSLLPWIKDHAIILGGVRHRLGVSSSSLALHWSPSTNAIDTYWCLKQRSTTNAIRCTFRLSLLSLLWFRFTRPPSSHGWRYFCAADTRISLSLSLSAPSADHHIRVRIITTPPMRDHSSFVIEGAACNAQEQGTRILFLCHSFKPTYGDDYCGDGADEHRATERASIHTIKPAVQGTRGIKIQAHQAAVAVMMIVMIDAWCASSHRSERVDQHQSSLALSRRKHTLIRGEFIGVWLPITSNKSPNRLTWSYTWDTERFGFVRIDTSE